MKQILYPLLKDFPITQGYGEVGNTSWYLVHYGIDYGATGGSEIVSCDNGEVVAVSLVTGYGNWVKIKHNWGYSIYGHQKFSVVGVGDIVKCGQLIGYVNSSGWSTSDHLHFECRDLADRVFDQTQFITKNIKEVIMTELCYQEVDQAYCDCKHRHLHINEITGGKDDSERNMFEFYRGKSLVEVYASLLRDPEGYGYIEKGRSALGIKKEL